MLLPFIDFAARNTPLHRMDRLAASLGLDPGRLFVKRDDLTGLAGGGNKARKLEYLVAEAQQANADVLVTVGAAQSNHVRATASAARMAGMECVAVLAEREPKTSAEGNLVLDDLLELSVVWSTRRDREATLEHTAADLRSSGRTPYVIPVGGSTPLGASAYINCADEIVRDLVALGEPAIPTVVVATGSGGTHAGLVAGLGSHDYVLGMNVAAAPDVEQVVVELAHASAALVGRPAPTGAIRLDPSQAEVPYGEPTEPMHEALRLVASTEGLILDPVYSGRAMAGLLHHARAGTLPDGPIVFVHTGGMPALFTSRYAEAFGIRTLHD